MSPEEMAVLHQELGFAFSLHVAGNVEWPLLEQLPLGTKLVFQTDDPDYNAWELQSAVRSSEHDDEPDRPATLIYVRVPKPPTVDGIDWTKARVLASLVMRKTYRPLAEAI